MSRGHPNCFNYRYDFFRKVVETLLEIDNEQVLQKALSITLSKLEKKDYSEFLEGFNHWGKAKKPTKKKSGINHREQLEKLGKI